ncbi:MAG: SPOR domain-containing protein, partial [Steroidobacteraceae bacterium]
MRERLIGALVLVAIVVLLVPSVLTGPDRESDGAPGNATRRVEVKLGDEEPAPLDEVLVPEPAPPNAPAPVEKNARSQDPAESDVATRQRQTENGPAHESSGKAAVAATPAETPAWAVQLGAFSNRDKAEQLVAELRRRGYAAFVLEYRATGQVLYRVRVGPEQD